MPYRRSGSPFWWISYTDAGGKRVRESSGTPDRQEATALEGGRRAEVHRVAVWGESQPRTVDEVLLQYLKDTPGKKSHDRDLYSAQRLQAAWSGRHLSTLDAGAVKVYKDDRKAAGVSDGTIARELGLLSTAIRHCNVELGWQLPNPTEGRIPQPRSRAPRWLTTQEAGRLIQAAMRIRRAPHLVDFIELGLSTGMRRDEMLRLEWDRVDLERRMVLFGEDDQKKGLPGSIPLSDAAVATLMRRRAWGRSHHPDSPWVFVNRFEFSGGGQGDAEGYAPLATAHVRKLAGAVRRTDPDRLRALPARGHPDDDAVRLPRPAQRRGGRPGHRPDDRQGTIRSHNRRRPREGGLSY